LVRWRGDGRIEFLGRIDHQVKIRGFRIELGEIEVVLGEHPGVAEAVVMSREEETSGKRLVAWVVAAGGATPAVAELRRYLAERLPDYMVPAVVVLLETLPLLPSGKVDRAALVRAPLPESKWEADTAAYAAPRGPVEEMLADIWTEVLGRGRVTGRVGIHDDFFELGGHSLLATQVISRVRAAFSLDLPLLLLFEKPTVAAFRESVEEALAAGPSAAPAIEPLPRQDRLPLSFGQQRLWFLDQLKPGDPSFNMPSAYRLPGALDRTALVESLNAIVARHEALRTTFASHEGKPYQVIAAALTLRLPVVDLRRLPGAAGDGEGRRLAVAEGRISFDLARGPLLRAILLRLEEEHLLLLSLHHIVADGWSLEILRRELAVLYEAFSAGRPCPLPDLRVQYADCALWQRRWLEGETLEAQLAYWRDRLREPLPVLELPADRPRRTDRAARGETCSAWLPESTAEGLRSLSREAGATLFMTMLAALDTLLHRYTGQTDLLVGTPVANRSRGESEGLIGFFVNTLVLRADLAGDPTFRELLARVRELALSAYAHADVPFEKLVEELKPERASSRTPLFRVMLLVRNASDETPPAGGRLLEPVETHNQTSQFDLSLAVSDGGRELAVGLE
ncbi:MAG: non-ribosomal peptide synthetase, partial [bacterium]|nr:non-ribosomal peptide synthetase [bacterium]